MKDTMTIYVCSCGREYEDANLFVLHRALNLGHALVAKEELTEAEYKAWIGSQEVSYD